MINVRTIVISFFSPSQDGVYVRSIFLEGAGWDKENSVLIEPAPMQLICNMPVIHFRPVEQVKRRARGKDNSIEYQNLLCRISNRILVARGHLRRVMREEAAVLITTDIRLTSAQSCTVVPVIITPGGAAIR